MFLSEKKCNIQVANPGTKDFFARLTIVPRKEGLEVVFFPYIFFYPVFFFLKAAQDLVFE